MHRSDRESARVSGARAAQGGGRADARRRRGVDARRGRGHRPADRRHGGGEGAGARRRPRQGRRREAGQDARRGARARRRRSSACRSRASPSHKVLVAPAADIATRGLRRPHPRPRDPAAGVHGEPRRRHRHRGSGGQDAGEDPPARRSIPRYGLLPHQALRLALLPLHGRQAGAGGREDHAAALQGVHARTAARWPRSTRWSPRPTGEVLALDAKMVDRRQRARPPPRPRRAARRVGRGRRARSTRATRQPHVHQARRQRRLRGQRRRPGHGHDGPGEVLRRRAGQLPRHRRQLESRRRWSTRSRSSPPTRT